MFSVIFRTSFAGLQARFSPWHAHRVFWGKCATFILPWEKKIVFMYFFCVIHIVYLFKKMYVWKSESQKMLHPRSPPLLHVTYLYFFLITCIFSKTGRSRFEDNRWECVYDANPKYTGLSMEFIQLHLDLKHPRVGIKYRITL